ncbi:MAG: DUF4123 domain-containing protein [Bordetella sp.]|nr:DUF4123 domain-containing protein [Bordetella sp.]
MSYFAVDSLDPSLRASMLTWWSEAGRRCAPRFLQLHALLDAAFDENGVAQYLATRPCGTTRVLYGGLRYESLRSVSPWLVLCDTSSAQRLSRDIDELFLLRADRPMLSFFAASMDPGQLRDHLVPWSRMRLPGDEQADSHLRIADTRILEALLPVLTEAQRQAFMAPGMGLWFPLRDGRQTQQLLSERGSMETASCEGPLHLEPQQFEALMDAAEPDLVIHQLLRTRPTRFSHALGSRVHAFVDRQVRRARARGLTETPDFVQYALTAWMTNAAFDEHPAFAEALTRRNEAGGLQTALDAVPDAVWMELAAARSLVRDCLPRA